MSRTLSQSADHRPFAQPLIPCSKPASCELRIAAFAPLCKGWITAVTRDEFPRPSYATESATLPPTRHADDLRCSHSLASLQLQHGLSLKLGPRLPQLAPQLAHSSY